nr:MAG TPA: hypothetical protein [Caudoviricetes sp.]DAZ55223.1 MAG TPA: hypothetical protein [Caudoviricetes sp.]
MLHEVALTELSNCSICYFPNYIGTDYIKYVAVSHFWLTLVFLFIGL